MSLRISNAELNSLLYSEPVGGYDAGFTDDPAMDEYLYEQESLDFLDIDLQDRYNEYEQEQQERMDDGYIDYHDRYSYDPYDYDWYDTDPLEDYRVPQRAPVHEKAVEERSRPMTIAEIVAKHKAELYHEH